MNWTLRRTYCDKLSHGILCLVNCSWYHIGKLRFTVLKIQSNNANYAIYVLIIKQCYLEVRCIIYARTPLPPAIVPTKFWSKFILDSLLINLFISWLLLTKIYPYGNVLIMKKILELYFSCRGPCCSVSTKTKARAYISPSFHFLWILLV